MLKINLLEKSYPDPKKRKKVLEFMTTCVDEWRDFETTTKDGRVVHTSWYNVRLSGEKSLGIGQDITERIKAVEEIQREILQPPRNGRLISRSPFTRADLN